MDDEDGVEEGNGLPPNHPLHPVPNDYDYSSAATGEDEDESEEEDENNDDQPQGQYLHQDQESNEPAHQQQGPGSAAATDDEDEDETQEEEGEEGDEGEDEDGEDGDEAVFPPPVIAEISEDSQEYYMKPPEKMDDGPKPFRCDLCDKRFQEKSSVYRHIKEVHRKIIVLMGEDGRIAKVKSSPVHSCCGTTFTTRRALLRHQKSAACSSHVSDIDALLLQSNKRKSMNGISSTSCKRNGSGMRNAVATSSEDDRFDDDEDSLDNDHDPQSSAPPASSVPLSMGIPYRCPYGVCPQFFTTKDLMTAHLKAVHRMRMELVSITAPAPSGGSAGSGLIPRSSLSTTTATGLTSTTISVTDKRFPCTIFGCPAAFTRKDRLNLHIRQRHGNNNNSSSSSSSNRGSFIPGLKVKLPSIQQDYRMIVSASKSSSSTRSHASSQSPANGLPIARPPKETIHPKKHACDYPGCEKSYTKNSHVKRHKLSAHPDLFPQSNGGSDAAASSNRNMRVLNDAADDEEEDDEEENEDAAGSDDDNFEVFDDQDDEPVVRRGKNMGPRITPTLKPSFLSLTSNKSNGNRKKK